jgi:hypothetical protein
VTVPLPVGVGFPIYLVDAHQCLNDWLRGLIIGITATPATRVG